MTDPEIPTTRDWWVRPAVMLPILLSVLIIIVLLAPEPTSEGRFGDDRLSAHLAGPLGARALREMAARFGFRVAMRDSNPVPIRAPGTTVHAVLSPPLPPTPAQAHRYLDAVRGGDALLLSLGERGPLSDSLGVAFAPGGVLEVLAEDSTGCGARGRDLTPTLWIDGRAHLFELRWIRGEPKDAIVFAEVGSPGRGESSESRVTAAGFEYGKGRVVVVSDPDQLRNDVVRRCAWGADVVAMRILEFLRAGGAAPRSVLEFDEYHQGFGPKPSTTSVTRRFLVGHPVGRMILQLALASLVLLMAVGPRAIAPRPRPRAERRDPLEQADALAHAYQQVHATRTATQRLLRGVRSRVEHAGGGGRSRDDDAFLLHAESLDRERSADVALVRRALRSPAETDRLPDIGLALRRIETTLTTTMSVPG